MGGPAIGALEFAIGDSSATFSADQIALQGTDARRAMLSGYPKITGATIGCAADFEPGSAPAELNEYGLFASGTMLNRLLVADAGPILPQHTCRPQMSVAVAIGGGGFTSVGAGVFAAAVASGLANVHALTLFLGLGDGAAPFSPDQLDMQGSTRVRRALAAGYPQASGADLQIVADFEAGSAPSDMREIALFDSLVGGNMIWRGVIDLGPSLGKAVSPMIQLTFGLPE